MRITYKSKAEIEGGSAMNSNSVGGSLGTNG